MKLLSSLLATVLFLSSQAQDTAMVRTFGGPYNDYGADIVETQDGGYAIIGTTGSLANGQSNMYLLKINADLEKEWSTSFGGSNVEWGTAIERVDDGFLLLGYTNSTSNGDYDIYLVKCDAQGDFEWEETYGGSDWDFGYDLLVSDGRIYIAGESWSYSNGQSDGYLIEVDIDGNEIWSEHIGGSNKDMFRDLFVGQNEVVAVGTENSGTSESRILLTSLNAESSYELGFIDSENLTSEGNAGMMYNDGNYYIVGANHTENTTKYGIFRTSPSFEEIPLFDIQLGLENTTNIAYTVIENSVEGIILVGESDSFTGTIGAYLVQLSQEAYFVEGPTFGGSGIDIGRKLIINSQQELMMLGETNSYGVGNYEVYLVKLPSDTISQEYVLDLQTHFDQLLTDVEESSLPNEPVMLAPNPAEDFTVVNGEIRWDTYSIFDLRGHLIQRASFSGGSRHITLHDLSYGTYIIQLDKAQKSIRTKLVVR